MKNPNNKRALGLFVIGLFAWIPTARLLAAQTPPRLSLLRADAMTPTPRLIDSSRADSSLGKNRFLLQGDPSREYWVEASSDLSAWVIVSTNRTGPDGTVVVEGPASGKVTMQFFRARLAAAEIAVTSGSHSHRILVKPKRATALSSPNLLQGSTVLRTFPRLGNWQVLRAPPDQSPAQAVETLRRSGQVEYAEPDVPVKLLAAPDDFRFRDGSLWNLHNTGQMGGKPDADIDAPEAWDVLNSAPSVVVAVIDTGVRATHEDLTANLWTNRGEVPGNGVDDDGDGYIDDVHGINAIKHDGYPNDDHGHGSHVAGIIGAVGNNGVGVVGVAWKVQMMACKFITPDGEGALSDAIECIEYARLKGANVINASWGLVEFNSQALKDAIAAARADGIVFVAAAGNSGQDNDDPAKAIYPASFDLDNIVSVLATTKQDALAFFSNWGATTVDLGVPGLDVFSCWNGSDDAYQTFLGSSMAAAHVSGACALAMAQFPGNDYRQIIQRILAGTDPLPELDGKCVTGGRLNLQKVLGSETPPPPPPPPPPEPPRPPPRGVTVSVTATKSDAAETGPKDGEFTIRRTGETTSELIVQFALSGTAENGVDYESLPASVNIPVGASATTVVVRPVDDDQVEDNESVVLTLSPDPAYAVGAPDSATVTIADNDQAPPPQLPTLTVRASDATATEGESDTAEIVFTRTGAATAELTVRFALGGTATKWTDYRRIEGDMPEAIAIPVGAASVKMVLRAVGDGQTEGAESVVVSLMDDGAYQVGSPSSAKLTIADNAPAPPPPPEPSPSPPPSPSPTPSSERPVATVVAPDPNASESGDPGEFTIRLSRIVDSPVTVRYAMGEEAKNGVDYQFLNGSVTIPAGASSATVKLVPIDDAIEESNEPAMLMLYSYAGAPYLVEPPDGATVIIADNDKPPVRPVVTVVASDATASESGDTGTFTIRLSQSTTIPITVRYAMGEEARNGVDYQFLSGSVLVPAGAISVDVKLLPIDDSIRERNEPAMLMLFSYAGAPYTVTRPDGAVVTILDND